MNILTLADLKADRGLRTVTNVCPNSNEFLQYVNSATRMILRRGDWFNLMAQAQFCTCDSCIVWPAFVGQIRAVNICGYPIALKNHWYEFMQFGKGAVSGCTQSDFVLVNRGRTPVFRQILCGTTRYVRVYVRCNSDVGKTVRIYGLDANGQALNEKDGTGAWIDGVTLTLAKPYVSTSEQLRSITRVSKQATECPVDLFLYDATSDTLTDAGHYGPKETEPSYVYSKLGGTGCTCPSTCASGRQITALFKMAQYNMVDDLDISPVQNLEAIKKMVWAVKKEEAGDSQGSEVEVLRAVKEMNLQDADEFPRDQVPVVVAPFGNVDLASKGIGRCI
jgi:hypothetical protein